jgi:uncharacterized Zn finger protein
MSKWHFNDWYFPTSVAKSVKGGIRAQKARGGFASHWWGRRWIDTLESFDLGARLTRGKSYARSGQVTELDVEPGVISAKVQGSRSKPYSVKISLMTFTETRWKKIIRRFADEPVFTAQLLSNDMSEGIEEVFLSMNLSLFPQRKNDLLTDCSCPDWSNPCKHIAAVYYLLAEAFDENPFLLFRLRGMELDEFLARLRGPGAVVPAESAEGPVPLPKDARTFWHVSDGTIPPGEAWTPMEEAAALPRRLGAIPFWRSEDNFHDTMEDLYASVSRTILQAIVAVEMKEGSVAEQK